jgi:hypothetical protein
MGDRESQSPPKTSQIEVKYLSDSLLDQSSEKRFFPYCCSQCDGSSEEKDEAGWGLGAED